MDAWRNLNRNGRRDPYEDSTRPIPERVEDLLGQMTLVESAGQMMHTIAPVANVFPGRTPVTDLIADRAMTHVDVMGTESPRRMA